MPIPIYSGPYITATPEVQVHDLTAEDKWVVVATDGLWDNVPKKQTLQIAQDALKQKSTKQKS